MCMPSRMMDGAHKSVVRKVPCHCSVRHGSPCRPGQAARYDYEYRREGTANLFLFVQPLRGWRHVNVTAHRTKHDFAVQMQELVDVHCPEADVIRLVVDNLNTHDTRCAV